MWQEMLNTVMVDRPRVFLVREVGKAMTIGNLIFPAQDVEVVSQHEIWATGKSKYTLLNC